MACLYALLFVCSVLYVVTVCTAVYMDIVAPFQGTEVLKFLFWNAINDKNRQEPHGWTVVILIIESIWVVMNRRGENVKKKSCLRGQTPGYFVCSFRICNNKHYTNVCLVISKLWPRVGSRPFANRLASNNTRTRQRETHTYCETNVCYLVTYYQL